jgi:hypothetical protein
MKELRTLKSSNVLLGVRSIIIIFVALAIFWIIATNRSPNFLRPLSMILRTGYTLVLPILFCCLYLVFRLKGWIGNLLSLLLTLSIFALALAGVWADGKTEAWLISGVLPMFDATNYYIDALRLLAGQQFSEYSANKPLFAALFTVLLWIANHNLLNALALLTLLVGLGCYLLAEEIKRTHSSVVAAFVLIVVFIYYRIHSGIVRTENLGVLFSVLGLALLWRAITEYHRPYYIAGIFVTSLALIARPGPMFILPAIVIWGAFFFKSKENKLSWKLMFSGGVAISLAFVVNVLLFWTLGAGDGLPFGRFPYALYGLVSGGNYWTYVLEINPDVAEPEIYRMAFELFREQPALIVKGALYNLSMFVSNTGYGLYSYMRGESSLSATVSYWILLLLSFIGVFSWVRKRDDPYLGFVIMAAIGLIASVPFLPPTDAFRLRLYASSLVILAMLPALGLWTILNNLHSVIAMPVKEILENPGSLYRYSIPLFTIIVVVLVLFTPLIMRGIEPPPDFSNSNCNDWEISLMVRYDPGTMIHLFPQNVQFLDWVPNIHIGTFRRNIHDFPSFALMDWALEKVRPNTTIFYALDYRTFRSALVVVDSDLLPSPPALLELCGKWEEDSNVESFNIFYVANVLLFDQD